MPARSAMVRLTRSSRSVPRALRQNFRIAASSSLALCRSSAQCSRRARAGQLLNSAPATSAEAARCRARRRDHPVSNRPATAPPRSWQWCCSCRGHLHDKIDSVQERPRNPPDVSLNLRLRAAAQPPSVSPESARARIHRRDEHEPRGKRRRPRGASNGDAAFFERLPQRFENAAFEFGELVEEQHAVVREADFAGRGEPYRRRSSRAPKSCDAARGMGVRAMSAVPTGKRAGDGVNRRAVERLVELERGKNSRRVAAPSSSFRRPARR